MVHYNEGKSEMVRNSSRYCFTSIRDGSLSANTGEEISGTTGTVLSVTVRPISEMVDLKRSQAEVGLNMLNLAGYSTRLCGFWFNDSTVYGSLLSDNCVD